MEIVLLCTISVNMLIVSRSHANEGSWFVWIFSGRMDRFSSDLLSFPVAAAEFEQCFILLCVSFYLKDINEGSRSAHFNVNLEFSLFLLGCICNENVPRKSVESLICVFLKLRCNNFYSVILFKENRQ